MLKNNGYEKTMVSIASHLTSLQGDLKKVQGKKGFTPQMGFLLNVVAGTLETFENGLPVLSDLPPAPSIEERRRRETAIKLERARERLSQVTKKVHELPGANIPENRQLIERFQGEVEQLERRVAELG